ncbi:MAG: aspartate/glutamate racemase family protein [bacterium]|nr:aspartate/glutamate racemase family protein [bacterium]
MKTIGLLGGMSWESTVPYYRRINQAVNEKLGGLHSAELLLYSTDFHEIEVLQHAGRWQEAGEVLAQAAVALQGAGAELLVICTNTMHKVFDDLEQRLEIPILHIADATAEAVKAAGLETVALLGTRFTMEDDFIRGRLRSLHGIEVLIPGAADREVVHRVIYDELCKGRILDASRARFVEIIRETAARGAQGVILGCTEISLLVGPEDSPVPTFDTTELHALKAVEWALADCALDTPAS